MDGKLIAHTNNKDVSIGSIALPNMYLNYLGEHKAKVSSHIVTIKDDEVKQGAYGGTARRLKFKYGLFFEGKT